MTAVEGWVVAAEVGAGTVTIVTHSTDDAQYQRAGVDAAWAGRCTATVTEVAPVVEGVAP